MMLRTITFYSITFWAVLFNHSAIAQINYPVGDLCDGDDIVCVEPDVGEYVYQAGAIFGSSVEEVVDGIIGQHDLNYFCDVKVILEKVNFSSIYNSIGSL